MNTCLELDRSPPTKDTLKRQHRTHKPADREKKIDVDRFKSKGFKEYTYLKSRLILCPVPKKALKVLPILPLRPISLQRPA
jgi:hypothetical protein